jgi:hypothetical protein
MPALRIADRKIRKLPKEVAKGSQKPTTHTKIKHSEAGSSFDHSSEKDFPLRDRFLHPGCSGSPSLSELRVSVDARGFFEFLVPCFGFLIETHSNR